MASRSQMRLAQITGSLSSAETEIAALGTDSLQGVMDHLASAIKRITGASNYHAQASGVFSQDLDIDGKIDVLSDISGSAHLMVAQNSDLKGTLAVAGQADFASNVIVASGAEYRGDLQYQLTASNGIVMEAAFKNDANRSFALDVDYAHAQFSVDDTNSIDMHYDGAGQFSADLKLASGDALEILAGGLELKSAITGSRTFKDAISMESTLGVDGKGTFNGEIQVIGAADLDGALDVQGAANFQNTVTVAGAADLNGALDVQGAANFQDNVVVAGNLTVNGTTTTVNTEEVTIADHNIVIDSNNSTAAVINGAGFTFDGGSGDDLTFQWNTSDSDMELKLGTAFAKLHIGNLDAADIAAANITLSANISAVDGDFTGNVSVGGTLGVTGAATLSDALSVAGAADIGGALDVSGIISGSSDMELTGNGQFLANIDVDGTATLFDVTIEDLSAGRLVATDASKNLISIDLDNWISGTPNQVNVTDVSLDGKVTLSTPQDIDTDADVEFDSLILGDMVAADIGRALKVGSAGLVSAATWDEFIAIEANVGLELAVHAGGFKAEIGLAQDIRTTASPEFAALNIGSDGDISIDGSNLVIDAPNGQLVFDDAHKASSTWSVGTPFELAADDAAWQSYIDSVGEVSLLEGIANAAQGSLDAGKWYYLVSSTVSVGSSVALSGMTSFADASTSPRAADVAYGNLPGVVASKVADVYVNGQLMMPGSDKDYVINASQEFEFKFQLEDQDIIQLVIR